MNDTQMAMMKLAQFKYGDRVSVCLSQERYDMLGLDAVHGRTEDGELWLYGTVGIPPAPDDHVVFVRVANTVIPVTWDRVMGLP